MAEPDVSAEPTGDVTSGSGDAAAAMAGTSALGSLADDLRELADDAQTLVEAELAYQSARAAYAWNRGRGIAIWLIVAATAGFFAVVALVVGLLLALATVVGVWGALGIVAVGLTLLAVLSLLRAAGKFRRMRTALLASDPIQPPARLVPAPPPETPAP